MSTEEQKNPQDSDQNQVKTAADEQPQPDQPDEETTPEAEKPSTGDGDGQEPDVEALQAEVERLRDEVLRTHAEMQNVRRRVDRDVENAHKYALEKFVAELLPVADNLERATASIDKDNADFAAVGEGVELTLKSFLDVLGKFNVEQVDPAGQPFDPERHQAMTMVPNPEVAANTVIEVFQKGYLLNGRLIRPAMVVVSQG